MNKQYVHVRQNFSDHRLSADPSVLLVPIVGRMKLVIIKNAKTHVPVHVAFKQDA